MVCSRGYNNGHRRAAVGVTVWMFRVASVGEARFAFVRRSARCRADLRSRCRGFQGGGEAYHGAATASPAGRPNVLLIVWDMVRVQSLSTYGSEAAASPVLTAMARQGVQFEYAFANSPWTLPSHASLFTGRHPGEHGADWLATLDGRWATSRRSCATPVTRPMRSLATTRMRAPYRPRTRLHRLPRVPSRHEAGAAVVGAGANAERSARSYFALSVGLKQAILGFDLTLRPVFGVSTACSRAIRLPTSRGTTSAKRRPYFAFLNVFDVHEADDLSRPPNAISYGAASRRERYERAIAHVDQQLGCCWTSLMRAATWTTPLVIVTSDHGEHFGENGVESGHGVSPYQATLQVPLVLRYPSRIPAGSRVAQQVELRDVAATVLTLPALRTTDAGSVSCPIPGPQGSAVPGDTILAEVSTRSGRPPTPNQFHALKALYTSEFSYIRRADGGGTVRVPDRSGRFPQPD